MNAGTLAEHAAAISLEGRVAIVTGGSKGLGLATATKFAGLGARVAILARSRSTLEEAAAGIARATGGEAIGVVCDVAKAAEVERAHAEVVAKLGPVDIMVNNAGQSRAGTLEEITDAVWVEDIEQKLLAAVRFSRLVWPSMKERRHGRIINVLSITSRFQREGGAPTAVTRAAGLAWTNILSKEGAPHNILVNALLVGNIVSDQIQRRHEKDTSGATLQQMIDDVGKTVPLGRMGTAEEFANAAAFLASDWASYISGTAIAVDGGLSPVI